MLEVLAEGQAEKIRCLFYLVKQKGVQDVFQEVFLLWMNVSIMVTIAVRLLRLSVTCSSGFAMICVPDTCTKTAVFDEEE